jgi:hypothetical protein
VFALASEREGRVWVLRCLGLGLEWRYEKRAREHASSAVVLFAVVRRSCDWCKGPGWRCRGEGWDFGILGFEGKAPTE